MYSRNTALSMPVLFISAVLAAAGAFSCPALGQPGPGAESSDLGSLSALELLPVDDAAKACLSELLRKALENNPELRADEAELAVAGGRRLQAGLRPNPGIELELDSDFERWATADRGIAVGYSHTFERGGKRQRRIAVSDFGYQVAAAQVGDGRRRLAVRLTSDFLQVLAIDREIVAQNRLLDLAAELERIVAERVRVGEDPALALSQARVERSRLAAERGLIQSHRRALIAEMRELIGPLSEALPEVAGGVVVQELPQTLDQLSTQGLSKRPDLAAARSEVERNRAELALQRAESAPNVVGYVRYSYDRLAFDVSGFNSFGRLVPIEDSSHGVTIGIDVDLPFRDRNQGNIAAALARVRSREFRVSALQASVRREVATAFERYQTTRDTLRSLDSDVLKQSRDTLEALSQAYRLGEIPFSEVLVEQRRVIDFELSYNDVMKEYLSAAVKLAGAAGMLGRVR